MRYNEFAAHCKAIEQERFVPKSSATLDLGIERCLFNQIQLKRLIRLASQATTPIAVRKKIIWEKRLVRTREVHVRFEKLKADSLNRISEQPMIFQHRTSPLVAVRASEAFQTRQIPASLVD